MDRLRCLSVVSIVLASILFVYNLHSGLHSRNVTILNPERIGGAQAVELYPDVGSGGEGSLSVSSSVVEEVPDPGDSPPDAYIRRGIERYDGYVVYRNASDPKKGLISEEFTIEIWVRTMEGGLILSNNALCVYITRHGDGFVSVGLTARKAPASSMKIASKLGDIQWHQIAVSQRKNGSSWLVSATADGSTVESEVGSPAKLHWSEFRLGGLPPRGSPGFPKSSCEWAHRHVRNNYHDHRCGVFFAGEIARVGLWERALSAEELKIRFSKEDILKGYSIVPSTDHDHWAEKSSILHLPLRPEPARHCPLNPRDSKGRKAGLIAVYLIGHLRAMPGVASFFPYLSAMKGRPIIVALSTPQHAQVVPKSAGRYIRVSGSKAGGALEALTAPSRTTIKYWWDKVRTLLPNRCWPIVTADILSEKHRERFHAKQMKSVPPLPESDKSREYIIRLFSSKEQMLETAHMTALRKYRERFGKSMPMDTLIIVSRPDIDVETLPRSFVEEMEKRIKRNPDQIISDYISMWVSNDQYFATSRKVIERLLSFDYACFASKTFLSPSSFLGIGFTRNLTDPTLKWGRDWYYAETSLIVLQEAIVGTHNISISEGGFKFTIRRDCPAYSDPTGNLRSAQGGNEGENLDVKFHSLNWTLLDESRGACGQSSPSCPDPFRKGHYPYVPKKVMRMFLQMRNKTKTEWEVERKGLLKSCMRTRDFEAETRAFEAESSSHGSSIHTYT
uniref:Uncharacterized protein n=1 Tax=Amorphochlora amoebiformis TaxID=1561963 RepID=A0A7S0H1K2_9EUKA|mmetsp:Transcript_28192/g.44877  ORF Transcript_28192/g.44877 Transcript_28192/m.44877 type:complete len:732 (+) Transcript_28192:14-2209(+)